jgi:raffinose/stachyose/melibiose transport system permease protein
MLMAPALLLYGVFLVYPTLRGIQLSFTNSQGVVGGQFIGLANYRRLLHDPTVISALKNILIFAVFVVIVQNSIALAIAYWLKSLPSLRNFVRGGLLLPSMMSAVTIGYVWSIIYSPVGGPLDAVMTALGLHGMEQVWLGDSRTALLAIALANIWAYIGYSATIYLSNYLAIPETIFDAAAVDGATGFRRFRAIDWRLLAPALTVNITLSMIGSLKVFELPLVMTNGGPFNTTESLSLLIYQDSFTNYQFGYGAAVSVLLLAITILVSLVLVNLLRRREVAF